MDAIKATLHSYKSLATRKQLQITLEVPEEYAEGALRMLGVADPSGVRWFAVTRIVGDAPAAPEKRERKRSEMAALMCEDLAFVDWLSETQTHDMEEKRFLTEADFGDALLKEVLGITSKRELDTLPHKGEAWDKLWTSYRVKDQVR